MSARRLVNDPDPDRTLRSSILAKDPFTGITVNDSYGKISYPAWFKGIKRGDYDKVDDYRFEVLIKHQTKIATEDGDPSYVTLYNYEVDRIFSDSAECLGCQFVILACFFPELVGTNIVEYAPIMDMKQHELADKTNFEEICHKCAFCDKYLPGSYLPSYHGLVISAASGGEYFPREDDEQTLSSIISSNFYGDPLIMEQHKSLMLVIPRKDAIIVLNDAAVDVLANTIAAKYCNVYHKDTKLDEKGWTIVNYNFKENCWKKFTLEPIGAGVHSKVSCHEEVYMIHSFREVGVDDWTGLQVTCDEDKGLRWTRSDLDWFPSHHGGKYMQYMELIGWYETHPKLMIQSLNTKRIGTQLQSIANLLG